VKREIFILQPIEKIRFLPVVEMTHSINPTFYKFINFDELVKTTSFEDQDKKGVVLK